MKKPFTKAFTLVELAIVLVIIGLLTGGVLGAQSLINSAKRSKVAAEFNGYETAMKAFYLEYDAYPGDLRNATEYWGKDATNCGFMPGTASATGTCNGNGDKDLTIIVGAWESIRAWQHLSLAGLVTGTYTGMQHPDGYTSTNCFTVPENNVPKSSFGEGAGYALWGKGIAYGINSLSIQFGACKNINNLNKGLFTAKEAKSFDEKYDDGSASKGRFFTVREFGIGPVCVTNDYTSETTDWMNLSSPNKHCNVAMRFYIP